MPPFVIEIANAEDVRDVVHGAVQALVEGKLIALPTETVYGIAASARSVEGVERLAALKGRKPESPFALAIKSAQELDDYAPDASPLANRLARRGWPGPVTLVTPTSTKAGLVSQLPGPCRQWVCPNGSVGLRCPAHPVVQDVLRMIPGPLALTSANLRGEPEAVTAAAVVEAVGDKLDLVVDDGPAHYGMPSSVVNVAGYRPEMLREGVVGQPTLDRLSQFSVLMVCTGNTCRSPMAEALMRRELASALDCEPDQLNSRGVQVASAGIQAVDGAPASREACELMAECGAPLDRHGSRRATEQSVQHADLVLTMTRGHRDAILSVWPDAAPRVQMLMPGGEDVADPIGGPLAVYRACAEQIQQAVSHHASAIAAQVRG